MTIKKIEWDDYLEVFFSKNEVVETWVRMRLLAFEYRTILYPNSNFDSIYKCTEENDVYFMELGRAHIALTCRYMYLMLYKGQYIIFGSADVDSLEPILKIKVIPTELTTDMDSIKHLIIEFLSFVSVSVKKNFVLID